MTILDLDEVQWAGNSPGDVKPGRRKLMITWIRILLSSYSEYDLGQVETLLQELKPHNTM